MIALSTVSLLKDIFGVVHKCSIQFFLVGLGKVIHVFVRSWARVQMAGFFFAKEHSTELSTLSLGHRHETICRVDDVSCTKMVVPLGVINLVGT